MFSDHDETSPSIAAVSAPYHTKIFWRAKVAVKGDIYLRTKPLKNPEILKINLRNTGCSSMQNRWSVDLLQRSAFGFAVSLTLIY